MADATIEQNLNSAEYVADPYPTYRRLRETAPVYWSESWNAWLLTRYADVVGAAKDPQRFSSAGRVSAILEHFSPADREQVKALEGNFAGGLINSDPPDHTRLRALINKAFTPRVVENLRPRVEAIVNFLLDQVEANGRMDAIRELGYPLPAIVIAEMLGVPPGDRDQFKRWADETAAFQGTGRAELGATLKSQQSLLALRDYLDGLIEDRRTRPRDDLLSALVAVEAEGTKLKKEELLSTCVTLMIAGHETTTSLIGHGLLALLRHPDLRQQLATRPELMAPAIEEMLRYDSPIQRQVRRAGADFEFGGQQIRQGQLVLLMLGAANRDPEQFPDPDRLDFERENNRHVAFGFGIHFCVGAPLARLEAPIALNALLKRFPDMSLENEQLAWQSRGIFRYVMALPVKLRSTMRCSTALTPDAAVSAAMNELRARYDAHYHAVVPHVTVAFPDECVGDLKAVEAQIGAVTRGVPAFTATFDRWVSVTELLAEHRAGTEFLLARYSNAANLLVFLIGQGADEILRLRRELSSAIPQPPELLDYPPYGTIGQSLSDEDFVAAKAALRDYRPNYSFRVSHLDFYAEQADGSWPILASLPLA